MVYIGHKICSSECYLNFRVITSTPFSQSSNIFNDENIETTIDKVVDIYVKDKQKLVTSKAFNQPSFYEVENLLKQVIELEQERKELEDFHSQDSDPELKKMASEDLEKLSHQIHFLKEQTYGHLLHSTSASAFDEVLLEVIAGVGGQEAMLFAQDLLQMYEAFCVSNGWEVEITDYEATSLGGIRYATLAIKGANSYASLKYEGGIHRVQRVPKTEKAGRVHTSTVSVAVLPQPTEILIKVDPKDIRMETMRASGAGGQHVNTTDSAVRLTHNPSGIVVECQTRRSQEQNRKEAMKKLRAKIYQKELDAQEEKFSSQKKLQVGTKGRSEKIRTYNFPQDRVTDHRLGISMHNITEVLSGGLSMAKLTTRLTEEGRKEEIVQLLYL
ncbi:UNVERIFIED_CONTAM: hypothetical protein GTU68_000572, partial [Idotea baltica]|nr:hypothetical protein [Idotea baltica]